MNKSILYIISCCVFLSCINDTPKVSERNTTFSPTNEELYSQCSELKGLGRFIIGETTYSEISKFLRLHSSFTNGRWSTYEEIASFINHKYRKIKQITIQSDAIPTLDFKHPISLAFYNDTLVAIDINENYHKIEMLLKQKYGDGKGYIKWTYKIKGKRGINDYYYEQTKDEYRTWENESISLRYIDNTTGIPEVYPEILSGREIVSNTLLPKNEVPTKINTEEIFRVNDLIRSVYEPMVSKEVEKELERQAELNKFYSSPAATEELFKLSIENSLDYSKDSYVEQYNRAQRKSTYRDAILYSKTGYKKFLDEMSKAEANYVLSRIQKQSSLL